MEYKRQSSLACLAYALYQIGRVDSGAVKEYEDSVIKYWLETGKEDGLAKRTRLWLRKYAEEFEIHTMDIWLGFYKIGGNEADLKGKGIILIRTPTHTNHAISFEDGIVLDPELEEERITLEEYLRKYNCRVIRIIKEETDVPRKGD